MLERPAVAVRVAERDERPPRLDVHVAGVHSPSDQLAPGGLGVGNDNLQAALGTGRHIGDPGAELQEMVAAAYQRMRSDLAAGFHHVDAAKDEKKAQVVGAFYQAVMIGVLAMRLVDPDHGPSARDLAEALRSIAADICGPAAQ